MFEIRRASFISGSGRIAVANADGSSKKFYSKRGAMSFMRNHIGVTRRQARRYEISQVPLSLTEFAREAPLAIMLQATRALADSAQASRDIARF